jgi:hypothetical protein
MTKTISLEVETGRHGKWEEFYKRFVKQLETEKENVSEDSPEGGRYKVDHDILYAEV